MLSITRMNASNVSARFDFSGRPRSSSGPQPLNSGTDVELLAPLGDPPRGRPLLVADRLPAARRRVPDALGRRDEQVEIAAGDRLARIDGVDVRAHVARPRVVLPVCLDGARPMVDRQELDRVVELLAGERHARGRAAGPAEEVRDLKFASGAH
jgi:hypothetical protein